MGPFSIDLQAWGLTELLQSVSKDKLLVKLSQGMSQSAMQGLEVARRYAPKDTGVFAENLTYKLGWDGLSFQILTADPELAGMLRTGTGIYGPQHQVISPVSARALFLGRWKNAAAASNYRGAWAYASIKGMPANPWEKSAEADIEMIVQSTMVDYINQFAAGM